MLSFGLPVVTNYNHEDIGNNWALPIARIVEVEACYF